eukprot:COSAG01_NODE_11150_length_1994_cov_1.278861_1_plen_171_part_10
MLTTATKDQRSSRATGVGSSVVSSRLDAGNWQWPSSNSSTAVSGEMLTESSDQCRPASATFGHTNAHSPAMTTRSAFSLADRPPSRGKAPPEALFLSGTLTSGRQEQPGVGCMQDRTSASYPTGAQIISQARPLSQPAVETNNSSNVTLSRPAFTTVPPASALAVPSKQPS